jgi:hypothetical protein
MPQDSLIPVRTPRTGRAIGYVHKRPPSAPPELISACHRLAYENLKGDYPIIVIDGRTFDAKTIFEKSGRKSGSYRAVGSSVAARYASRRINPDATHTNHAPSRMTSHNYSF